MKIAGKQNLCVMDTVLSSVCVCVGVYVYKHESEVWLR